MAKSPVGKSSGKTPGTVLEKYIKDYNLSTNSIALELGQNSTTFKKLLDGSKRVTVELALLLAKKFDTTPEFWLDLQTKVSLAEAKSDPKFQQRLKDLKKAEKKPKIAAKPAKTVKSAGKPKKAPGRKPGRSSAAKVTAAPKKKPGRKLGKKPASPPINSGSSFLK
jgi:addiction module HigA family antidote